MISENKYLLFFIGWYIFNYGPPPIMVYYFLKAYYFSQAVFANLNKTMHPDFWKTEEKTISSTAPEIIKTVEEVKPPPKYEDKYLDIVRKLNKEWLFSEDEQKEETELAKKYFIITFDNYKNRKYELIKMCSDLKRDIENDTDEIIVNDKSNITYHEGQWIDNEDGEQFIGSTLEERNAERNKQIEEMTTEIEEIKLLLETNEGLLHIKEHSYEVAKKFIIQKKIDKLDNCHVIEKTPQGNVLMMYDKDRETFKYYSDMSIPYRYLEVVARKYVKFFDCRPLFIDMEEELKLFEEKWEKEQEIRKKKEEEEKIAEENQAKINNSFHEIKKRNVFAKFKSYNKDSTGKIGVVPPPKNNIPNKSTINNKENEKILLKEKANRFTHGGKFSSYNFLKKPEKKVGNKKQAYSYNDFKYGTPQQQN